MIGIKVGYPLMSKENHTPYLLIFTLVVIFLNACSSHRDAVLSDEYVHTYSVWEPNEGTWEEVVAKFTVKNGVLNGESKALKRRKGYSSRDALTDTVISHALSWQYYTYGNYRKGKKDGLWRTYLGVDSVEVVSNYSLGQLHGPQYSVNEVDTLYLENYQYGLPHGRFLIGSASYAKEISYNGCLRSGGAIYLLNYHQGVLSGRQQSYYDGVLVDEMVFLEGRLVSITRFNGTEYDNLLDQNGDGELLLKRYGPWKGLLSYLCKLKKNGYPERCVFTGECYFNGLLKVKNGFLAKGEYLIEACGNQEAIIQVNSDRSITILKARKKGDW